MCDHHGDAVSDKGSGMAHSCAVHAAAMCSMPFLVATAALCSSGCLSLLDQQVQTQKEVLQ
jgi:hypothetical protein